MKIIAVMLALAVSLISCKRAADAEPSPPTAVDDYGDEEEVTPDDDPPTHSRRRAAEPIRVGARGGQTSTAAAG